MTPPAPEWLSLEEVEKGIALYSVSGPEMLLKVFTMAKAALDAREALDRGIDVIVGSSLPNEVKAKFVGALKGVRQ